MTFDRVFRELIGYDPYPYQCKLACGEKAGRGMQEWLSSHAPCETLSVNVPTGLGKTAAVVMAWFWNRVVSPRTDWPRRFVFCLPMRVLVEQTAFNVKQWLKAAGIPVSILMGGAEKDDWANYPERNAVLIGTQDMLLSRLLNRGFAASRSRWPVEFGLLHNDCLWVFDEVQLMGSGLATTVQLDGFATKLWKPAVASKFIWMSATLGESFLHTRDRKDWNLTRIAQHGLEADDLIKCSTRLDAPKTLNFASKQPSAKDILDKHLPGRISLLILNTVPAAKSVYEEILNELKKPAGKGNPKRPQPEICLLHSRFRPMDRARQMKILTAFVDKMDESGAVPASDGMILVSTQVVEAGIDLSSARLWSEIAPWASIVQRLGRLNREGQQPKDSSATFWKPKSDDSNDTDAPNAKRVGPYERSALDTAKKLLDAVIEEQGNGKPYRAALNAVLETLESRDALLVKSDGVIRPSDFFELFSTEPDLAGGFTNVSQFVRDQDRDVDVYVFWRDFDSKKMPDESCPERDELCSVPFFEFRNFVKPGVAWEWNFESGKWEKRRAADIQAGMTLLLPKSAGGYRADIGWTGNGNDRSFEVQSGTAEEDSLNTDVLSNSKDWVSLEHHLADVKAEMDELLQALGLQGKPMGNALVSAARWHDWGKAGQWQNAVKRYAAKALEKLETEASSNSIPGFDEVAADWMVLLQPKDGTWGKFPDVRAACLDARLVLSDSERWQLSRRLVVPFRPGMRHEAASALAAWQAWLENSDGLTALTVYLIASHHGKVRTVLRSTTQKGDDVFGIVEGTELPPVANFFANAVSLQTDVKSVGACGLWNDADGTFTLKSPSWLQMVAELLGSKREGEPATSEVIPASEPRDLGPLTLAYLEALLRAADVRASKTPGKGGKS